MTEAARWAGSLRLRLFGATLMAALVALVLAGALLASLFRDHVQRQFAGSLTAQLDQVTARLEFDAAGEPRLDAQTLSDPRWSRPLSGLYWQVDGGEPTARRRGLLRSRSLWDAELAAPPDTVADGQVHVHETTGPNSSALLLVERTVRRGDGDPRAWRVLVAGDRQATEAAVARFNGILLVSLAALLALLCAAAVAQVAVGLAPLRGLQRALTSVHAGRSARLEGRFPSEVQPLIDDFNAVLDRNAEVVARARQEAGNLAHAIKTPLAAMAQAAAAAPDARADLAPLVQEQVGVARRHVEWHLTRARAAASQRLPGARAALAPVLAALLRVMQRVHAERHLSIACEPVDPDWALAGEVQDLQEIVGNVLDNACKWARSRVHV
ncbi:MAG: ATP-binding protein, partial [Rhizobacter sp.]|nr:ATP-binding protein [Rhizobacter sp.]